MSKKETSVRIAKEDMLNQEIFDEVSIKKINIFDWIKLQQVNWLVNTKYPTLNDTELNYITNEQSKLAYSNELNIKDAKEIDDFFFERKKLERTLEVKMSIEFFKEKKCKIQDLINEYFRVEAALQALQIESSDSLETQDLINNKKIAQSLDGTKSRARFNVILFYEEVSRSYFSWLSNAGKTDEFALRTLIAITGVFKEIIRLCKDFDKQTNNIPAPQYDRDTNKIILSKCKYKETLQNIAEYMKFIDKDPLKKSILYLDKFPKSKQLANHIHRSSEDIRLVLECVRNMAINVHKFDVTCKRSEIPKIMLISIQKGGYTNLDDKTLLKYLRKACCSDYNSISTTIEYNTLCKIFFGLAEGRRKSLSDKEEWLKTLLKEIDSDNQEIDMQFLERILDSARALMKS